MRSWNDECPYCHCDPKRGHRRDCIFQPIHRGRLALGALIMAMLLMLLTLPVRGAPPQAPPPQDAVKTKSPQAPPVRAVPPPQAPSAGGYILDGKPLTVPVRVEDYEVKRAEAIRRNLPLIVFVGQKPYHSDYWSPHLMAYTQSLEGSQPPCVVVGVPRDGDLYRQADLPGKPSLNQIEQAMRPKSAGVLYPVQGYEPPNDGSNDFWEVPERGGQRGGFFRGGGSGLFRGGSGFRFFGGRRGGGGGGC